MTLENVMQAWKIDVLGTGWSIVPGHLYFLGAGIIVAIVMIFLTKKKPEKSK